MREKQRGDENNFNCWPRDKRRSDGDGDRDEAEGLISRLTPTEKNKVVDDDEEAS